MEEDTQRQLAGWLAEAFTMGNPLAALPPALTPPDAEAGTEVAGLVLEQLGLPACGLRHLPGTPPLVGPMIEGRLLASGTPFALATLRHARVAPAVVAHLAEPLAEDGAGLPAFASLHPALDISGSRFTVLPQDPAILAADLACLGHVVAGRGRPQAPAAVATVALRIKGRRAKPQPLDLAAALGAAASEARALGGLPTGAVLVVVLGPGQEPVGGQTLVADFGPLGRASVSFV